MKIIFPLPTDKKRHRYCQNCHSEKVHDETIDGKKFYKCDNCGNTYDRLIDIDPQLVYWVDEKTKEYWHESVGVFVSNAGRILFMDRTIYPYGHTIPAGHLEVGEEPQKAAARELWEETGIKTENLTHFKGIDIEVDPCRRGADMHRWHVYTLRLETHPEIVSDPEEGKNPVWLTPTVALKRRLTAPVQYLLETYGVKLLQLKL